MSKPIDDAETTETTIVPETVTEAETETVAAPATRKLRFDKNAIRVLGVRTSLRAGLPCSRMTM